MNRIKALTLFLFFMSCLFMQISSAFAQSDIDLLDSVPAQTDTSDVDINKSLSDNLAQETPDNSPKEEDSDFVSPQKETWLKSLITKGTNEIFKTADERAAIAEQKRLEEVLMKRKSNAANFDISGVRLRMNPSEIQKKLKTMGYRLIAQDMRVPNFIKWRSEELCRINGIVGYERLNACAANIARENGFEYIASEVYNRYATRESIEVSYTSTFTDNLSYHIVYKSEVPLSSSKASQNVYINNLKIYDFWRRIDLRYGQPDNTSEIKWGLGGKKPYLQASTGRLELMDPILKDLDVSRMLNEDSRFANIEYYTF